MGVPMLALFLLSVGCNSTTSVPLDEIEAPVAFINHPDAGRSASRSERELMVLDASSGRVWQLTSDGFRDSQPTWSPSGTHLLFLSSRPSGRFPGRSPGLRSPTHQQLFVYDLRAGRIAPIDISWAYDDGPAAPTESEQSMRSLGWLECAAWSPIDTTQIAIGVTAASSTMPSLTRRNRSLVLLDTEARTARLIADYDELCGGLQWSPDGRYISIIGMSDGTDDFDYVEVDTGKKLVIQGGESIDDEETYFFTPIGWGPAPHNLLVSTVSHETLITDVYIYDVESQSRPERLGRFPSEDIVEAYMPGFGGGSPDSLGLIVRRQLETSFFNDLWVYQWPEGSERRVTRDRMPKLDVVSFHGKKP